MTGNLYRNFVKTLVNRNGILFIFAIFVLLTIIIGIGVVKIYVHSNETIIDLKFNYTPDDIYSTLDNMGEYDRRDIPETYR